ncbi:MAG: hypothetical protein WC586_06570 [Methanoregula sp.]
MDPGLIRWAGLVSFVILAVTIAGCTSYAPLGPEGSLPASSPEKLQDLATGDTAILSGPGGNLEVTVAALNASTGKILITEKNTGVGPVQYEPKIWLHDTGNTSYTTLYCRTDICPGYVFITSLQSLGIENREFDSLYDTFRIPESGRHTTITLYWSVYGQTASWIIPAQ